MVRYWESNWLNIESQIDLTIESQIDSYIIQLLTLLGRIIISPVTQLLRSTCLIFSLGALREKLSHFDLKSCGTWVETKTFELKKKKIYIYIYCIGYPKRNGQTGQSSIIAKDANKQNTSKLLRYKLYIKIILKMILK